MIDRTAIKTNQAVIIAVCVIAALVRWPALVGIGALLVVLGAAAPGASPILSHTCGGSSRADWCSLT